MPFLQVVIIRNVPWGAKSHRLRTTVSGAIIISALHFLTCSLTCGKERVHRLGVGRSRQLPPSSVYTGGVPGQLVFLHGAQVGRGHQAHALSQLASCNFELTNPSIWILKTVQKILVKYIASNLKKYLV